MTLLILCLIGFGLCILLFALMANGVDLSWLIPGIGGIFWAYGGFAFLGTVSAATAAVEYLHPPDIGEETV